MSSSTLGAGAAADQGEAQMANYIVDKELGPVLTRIRSAVRAYCDSREINRQEFARELGLRETYFRDLFSGRSVKVSPSRVGLAKLATAMGYSVDELLDTERPLPLHQTGAEIRRPDVVVRLRWVRLARLPDRDGLVLVDEDAPAVPCALDWLTTFGLSGEMRLWKMTPEVARKWGVAYSVLMLDLDQAGRGPWLLDDGTVVGHSSSTDRPPNALARVAWGGATL